LPFRTSWRTTTHTVCFTAAKWRAIALETQSEKAAYGSFGSLD
jgi:hypothetical protein